MIEDVLEGEEVSFFAVIDGDTCVALASAQDHKAVGEGDTGDHSRTLLRSWLHNRFPPPMGAGLRLIATVATTQDHVRYHCSDRHVALFYMAKSSVLL